ncbi:MAG: hypothetical protein J6X02_00225 [Bacilli bacterium]|nr:hypothetical protein [Bacilli bacterium]
MRDGQNLVKGYVEKRQIKNNYLSWYIDFINEYGELGRTLLRGNQYFDKNIELTDEMKEHLGDVYFNILAFTNELGADAEECLAKALAKYERKFNENNN